MSHVISSQAARSRSVESASSTDLLGRYALIATCAAAIDLITKAVATSYLADGSLVSLTKQFSLFLVYNTGTAGGYSIGEWTQSLNVFVTLMAIGMVIRIVSPLAAVDARATRALALVTGGAFGNLASMVVGPAGVADFLAVHLGDGSTIVMNVADLMLWTGSLMLVPVVGSLLRAIRQERLAR